MRKRAQLKMSEQSEPATAAPQPQVQERKRFHFKTRKNWWVGFCLIVIFFLVLFMNSYFSITTNANINPSGTTLGSKFLLSGPDPYYNIRLVNSTITTGQFPYYSANDPLLAYPSGHSGGRPPLLSMSAIGFSYLLRPFMSVMDAVGYSMAFVPALFGALLVFPVFFIGKILFGRKAGLLAALLIALIPIEISSGHGSAFALFDHDSLNLLFYFLTFLFMILSIKEKDRVRSILYALLGGVCLGGLALVWVDAVFLYTLIMIYVVVQLLFDIFTKKIEEQFVLNMFLLLFVGVLVSLPVTADRGILNLSLYISLGVLLFGGLCILFKRRQIPWIVSIPSIAIIAGVGLAALYVIFHMPSVPTFLGPIQSLAGYIPFIGSGIYGGKVSLTIAEAGTYSMSRTVMSFGPAVYWLGWAGFALLIYLYYKQKWRKDYLFILTLFAVDMYLTTTAGRFLNDMVPVIAILSGWIIWFIISKIDYKQMARNIRNAGGGFRGLRKGIRVYHILGIFFVAFLIFIPNGFLAFDAATPAAPTHNGTSNLKYDFFGKNFSSAFASSSFKEQYWTHAFSWLNEQDTNIANPAKRPAFISWWDYGFYEVAVGGHPTVADNFQDGIPTAANFHIAKSEKEGIAVWTIHLLEGNLQDNKGAFSPNVVAILQSHLGANNSTKVIQWMEHPTTSPSYHAPIGFQYDGVLSRILVVASQYPQNAYYHDITSLLNQSLTDGQITWLYHDIQKATGYTIRYYGVEGYDEQIFNIFAFLADSSNVLTALRTPGKQFHNPEDDYIQVKYTGYTVNQDGTQGPNATWTADELNSMEPATRARAAVSGYSTIYKADYFKTMFYMTYIGTPAQQDSQGNYQMPNQQVPCYNMKHFVPVYVSPYPYYSSQKSAVIIAKYYEGAFFNGTVKIDNQPLQYVYTVILDQYGISHDATFTDANGSFNLIAPAGNMTLLFSYANEVLLKHIHFNSTTNSLYAPITDPEAMRVSGSNYTRDFNLSVNYSTLQGFVYRDTNNNGTYQPGVDTPVPDITIQLTDQYFGRTIPTTTTDAQGHYMFQGLYPSKYNVTAINPDGFTLGDASVPVPPDMTYHNISVPKPAALKGTVYYDTNGNTKYDAGEEASGVQVRLLYTKFDKTQMKVTTTTTGADGTYSFTALIPGSYTVNASKRNATTGNSDYLTEQTATLTANVTTTSNILLAVAPILAKGYTFTNTTYVNGISVRFSPDTFVKNNSATKSVTATSSATGAYAAKLAPGSYNVSVSKSIGQTLIYSFDGKLAVTVGEGNVSYPIPLIKHTVTVSGTTKFDTTATPNIKIDFKPDTSVQGNTAVQNTIVSNATGVYTVEITPGTYDVTVNQTVNETGHNVTYTFSQRIVVASAQLSMSYNILLIREQTP
jgi:dolichyl-diphosphooligosaccharide--protein glycosyltransferase